MKGSAAERRRQMMEGSATMRVLSLASGRQRENKALSSVETQWKAEKHKAAAPTPQGKAEEAATINVEAQRRGREGEEV